MVIFAKILRAKRTWIKNENNSSKKLLLGERCSIFVFAKVKFLFTARMFL